MGLKHIKLSPSLGWESSYVLAKLFFLKDLVYSLNLDEVLPYGGMGCAKEA